MNPRPQDLQAAVLYLLLARAKVLRKEIGKIEKQIAAILNPES